jgi:metal-sulfur cluster biosynthetic enzyme
MRTHLALLIALLTAVSGAAHAEERTAAGLFDQRYCEVLTIERARLKLQVTVYNTLGYNTCPEAAWAKLDAKTLAKELEVDAVELNGSRHWLMDGIIGKGATAAGEVKTFGGIEMAARAEINMPLLGATIGKSFYQPTDVRRETVWLFAAGKPVFELTDPKGQVYMMQSYAQIVDPKLTLADLPGLGKRLKLPTGWTYSTRVLTEDFRLEAKGVAHVLQDELQNTYQRRTP